MSAKKEPWKGVAEDGSVGFECKHEGRTACLTFAADGSVELYVEPAPSDAELTALRRVAEAARYVVRLQSADERKRLYPFSTQGAVRELAAALAALPTPPRDGEGGA